FRMEGEREEPRAAGALRPSWIEGERWRLVVRLYCDRVAGGSDSGPDPLRGLAAVARIAFLNPLSLIRNPSSSIAALSIHGSLDKWIRDSRLGIRDWHEMFIRQAVHRTAASPRRDRRSP